MDNIEFRHSAINASDCLSAAWQLVKPNYAVFVAMIFVFLVATVLIGIIPYVGGLLNVLIAGTLLCGIYSALLHQQRGTDATFSMMFGTFDRIVPIVLIQLIQSLPFLVLPIALYFVPTTEMAADSHTDFSQFGLPSAIILLWVLAYLVTIVLALLLFFALPLIADRHLGFAEAARLSIRAAKSNIGGIIVLGLLQVVISIAGAVALCIGIFFVAPIIYAMNIAAYRSVFPDEPSTFGSEPPRPDAYGEDYGMPI